MKNFVRILVRIGVAAVVLAGSGMGQQVTKVGTTAAKFLSIPAGARAVGMGGAFVAVANDASAMYWNPAGIARIPQSEVLITHSAWIADVSYNYGGVVFPFAELGTLGINFTSLSMGEMERTTEDQPEGTGQFFSAGSFAVGVSFARNLTDWFSIGTNVKYIDEHIWNSGATGMAVDIGTLFTTPFTGVKFGAGISNFGPKMHMTGDDLLVQKDLSPNNGNNANINAMLTTDYFELPLNLRIGLAYDALVTESQHLIFVADAVHPNDNSESISVGAEYTGFQNMLSLRTGYSAIGVRNSEEKFTVGGGFQYHMEGNIVFKLDYAYQNFGVLNDVHKFAIGILF